MNKKRIKQLFVILCLSVTAMLYTGCGNNKTDATTTGDAATTVMPEGTTTGAEGDTGTDAGVQDNNGASSLGEDVENAADDVADGVGDAVDDLAGVDYGDYDSAHKYLMGQIGGTKNSGKYEVRNENRELTNYDTSDSSRKGYRYEIYDTSKGDGEKYGVFYVDQETGKIYKESGKNNKIEEYKVK